MNDELEDLIEVLADWANGHDCVTIYLFGSRVRSDHRPDSDVDVVVRWSSVTQEFSDWWIGQNEDEFCEINTRLPGPLKILEYNDPITQKVISSADKSFSKRQNVVCVWLPPKTAG